MGGGFFTCFLVVVVLLRCSASLQLNTDEFFVSDFFLKMGAKVAGSSSVCSWKGVTCDERREKVIALVASGFGLSGVIPENTIGKLSKLRTLDLSANNITGLSSDIWELGSSLRSLNLSWNQINGSLPNNLANFGELESLVLSYNSFSGEIPTALGSLRSLKVLNFSGNGFEGSLPDSILGCESLVSIDLSSNRLNGTVPNGLDDAFKNLTFLDLSGNEMNGRLPELSGLNSITYINLSGNLFEGSILGLFREIDLSNNQLQGHISQVNLSSSYTWSSLVYLDLSGNELSGEFFSDLGRARSLKHLNLAFNMFSHQNFPQLEQLSGLEYLNLSKTSLTGQIPTEFSKLFSLKTLDLSHNHITGYIPDLSMDNLQVLDLSMNNLTGGIPKPLLDKLPNMTRFNFSYNHLKFCAAELSPQTFNTAFVGSVNDCPIAVDPDVIKSKGTKHRGLKLALAISLSFFFLIAGLVCLAIRFRKRTGSWAVKQLPCKEEPNVSGPFSFQTDSTTWVADVKSATSVPVVIFEKPLLNFTFADLLTATSHFDRGTLLAEGKFGPVYRGILPGGIHVAVKVLVRGSAVTDQEAARELERLGWIKHPNLVPLTGYCLAGDQRIAIYDYMENGNLQNLLHDLPLGVQTTEDWSTDTWEEDAGIVQNITTEGMTTWRFRHKIALGAARSLAFLHHGCYPQIVHRDVKANSIYLDSELEPRLSDFGLSNIAGATSEDEISQGSPGYAPPEFSESENVSATTRSDVYGFGVVLFELVTGKKPIGDDYPEERETTLVSWARTFVKKNRALRIIDPKIRETGSEKQMEEALRIAYLCTADLPSKRPSMQQIVGLLKDIEPIAADH
ncbi:putative LRR receptor-like serine/threonine-protein kinase [Cocos nucifera]|uniref:Putative LRR receptor-like serine/threonine-protein kinase n=1 Tax=Cocos nucifera TaxID=13894 RepID=A0A8K0N8S8_COCNU|nr:putative LRR receptor-like serine/threonine-protein kinase [Cocos nucifera]KAG1363711.1 putative LRR receptor-like serine/threonine-protein kinase [Cocos nucifera]